MAQAGEPAPPFSITAAVSEREISPEALAGKQAVLIFHGQRTAKAAKEVGKAVRAAHPSADEVVVGNIIDLRKMGGMWKKVAMATIKQQYEKIASRLQDGYKPEDYIVICPDWDASATQAFGFEETDEQAGLAVIGADGKIKGIAQGEDLPEKAVELLG